jgi:hypothetical protein
MLKRNLRDKECNSNEDIEEAITVGKNDFTFNNVQLVLQN